MAGKTKPCHHFYLLPALPAFVLLLLDLFLLALLLSINANVEQWSNHGLF